MSIPPFVTEPVLRGNSHTVTIPKFLINQEYVKLGKKYQVVLKEVSK